MGTTLMGQPGDDERDEEVARVIYEFEELLRLNALNVEKSRVQEVGRSIITIVDSGFERSVGHTARTGFVMPRREFPPGIYGFN